MAGRLVQSSRSAHAEDANFIFGRENCTVETCSLHIPKGETLGYNTGVNGKSDAIKLLRVAALLLLGYLGLSAAIDYTLKSPGSVEAFFYLVGTGIALLLLISTFWNSLQGRLGRAFLPLVVTLISALPILADQIAARYLFAGPFPPPEAVMARVAPFLLIGLLLIAWQYRWQHIVVFSLAIALVNIAVLWVYGPNNAGAFSAGLFAILSEVVTFVVAGLFISVMVGWLRSQRHSLEEANTRLTNYSQTLEDLAATRERNRIAQELHDTLSHTLSGLSVQLEAMKAYWDVDPATARQRLDRSLTAARSGLEETRRILMALRAKPLEELGLATAIRQLAEDAAARGNLTLELHISDNVPALPPATEQCIFRVAQEAITNVLSHARAQRLTVDLGWADNMATLAVRDDGLGFDPAVASDGDRFGLKGMRERAELVKGRLTIASQPARGTTVQLSV